PCLKSVVASTPPNTCTPSSKAKTGQSQASPYHQTACTLRKSPIPTSDHPFHLYSLALRMKWLIPLLFVCLLGCQSGPSQEKTSTDHKIPSYQPEDGTLLITAADVS